MCKFDFKENNFLVVLIVSHLNASQYDNIFVYLIFMLKSSTCLQQNKHITILPSRKLILIEKQTDWCFVVSCCNLLRTKFLMGLYFNVKVWVRRLKRSNLSLDITVSWFCKTSVWNMWLCGWIKSLNKIYIICVTYLWSSWYLCDEEYVATWISNTLISPKQWNYWVS